MPHSAESHDNIRARAHRETIQLVTSRTRILSVIVAIGMSSFALLDASTNPAPMPARYWLLTLAMSVMLLCMIGLGRARTDRAVITLSAVAMITVYASTTFGALLVRDEYVASLTFCALAMVTAAFLPWGMRAQVATVCTGATLLAATFAAVGGVDGHPHSDFFSVAIALSTVTAASIYLADQGERQRERILDDHMRLVEAHDQVAEANTSLERRVQERTAELEALNRDLRMFSYSVSHDLRAPLRSVDGYAAAVLEDYGEELAPRAVDWIERVRTASQRMDVLIDELLRLANAGGRELSRAPVDLGELARSVAEDLRLAEPARSVTFEAPEAAPAVVDPTLMRALLQNLIGNAWKYTRENPTATIHFGVETTDADGVTYFVRDDGAGFDMKEAERLFEPFVRLRTDVEGTGLGLATVRRIAERHGGRAWAESAPGNGSVFYFSLDEGDERTLDAA